MKFQFWKKVREIEINLSYLKNRIDKGETLPVVDVTFTKSGLENIIKLAKDIKDNLR